MQLHDLSGNIRSDVSIGCVWQGACAVSSVFHIRSDWIALDSKHVCGTAWDDGRSRCDVSTVSLRCGVRISTRECRRRRNLCGTCSIRRPRRLHLDVSNPSFPSQGVQGGCTCYRRSSRRHRSRPYHKHRLV
eukprot:05100_5